MRAKGPSGSEGGLTGKSLWSTCWKIKPFAREAFHFVVSTPTSEAMISLDNCVSDQRALSTENVVEGLFVVFAESRTKV